MLGFIGFLVAAIAIGGFAYTSHRTYGMVPEAPKRAFVTAYACLAAAMLIWAFTVISVQGEAVKLFILASDVLLLVGTAFMLRILLGSIVGRWWVIALLSLVGALAVGLRAYVYVPDAFVSQGLLHFNLSGAVFSAIVVPFIVIWLPASVLVSYMVTGVKSLASLRNPMAFSFMTLVLMNSFFLSAKDPVMIISLFIGIIILFVALVGMNFIIMRLLGGQRRPGHGAER